MLNNDVNDVSVDICVRDRSPCTIKLINICYLVLNISAQWNIMFRPQEIRAGGGSVITSQTLSILLKHFSIIQHTTATTHPSCVFCFIESVHLGCLILKIIAVLGPSHLYEYGLTKYLENLST